MATHFKWYGSDTATVVPFNANFEYPSQANKAVKSTPRLQPKNGGTFVQGNEIRIEIPAMGYMNGSNTTLSFDVTLEYTPHPQDASIIRFQNNIQSIFDRVSVMYGSTPLEDISKYNQLVRSMTEWTTTGDFDQGSVAEGIGHSTLGCSGYVPSLSLEYDNTRPFSKVQNVNIRQAYIQGISLQKGYAADGQNSLAGEGFGCVPYTPEENIFQAGLGTSERTNKISITRRYVVNLQLGILTNGKLIPTKYMASQLALVFRLARNKECIFWQKSLSYDNGYKDDYFQTSESFQPSYSVTNVQLIPEVLEFDSSYDSSFLDGLADGVPILFSSFNTYQFSSTGSSAVTLAIPERNRSIKSVFTMQVRSAADYIYDSGASFYTTGARGIIGQPGSLDPSGGDNDTRDTSSTLQEYQYRIGNRYFPASPVQCSQFVGAEISNGGAEAYVELAKALGTLGDYRLSTPLNVLSWASPIGVYYDYHSDKKMVFNEYDGKFIPFSHNQGGCQVLAEVEAPIRVYDTTGAQPYLYGGRSGSGMNSCCFAMAINLETSNGMEISGLNAEEQSDISISMKWSSPQSSEMQFLVYTYYDAMIVLKDNNVVQLIK